MLQSSKTFLFTVYWVVYLSIEKSMLCSSIVNKATGQVCCPAEKNRLEKKLRNIQSKWNRLLQTRDISLTAIWQLTAIEILLVAG